MTVGRIVKLLCSFESPSDKVSWYCSDSSILKVAGIYTILGIIHNFISS